ncbi:MAG TPA: carboxypeptidase-like regulatory domain-containing protein [Pyrinomonadaceae bacterium]|nr:carboxypeptidase-like regulatory domain-containing protein [Pyrinomonadaceae bacterium]
MRHGLRTFFLVLLVLAVCVPAFAQAGSTGSLSGTVLDPKGAVVAGASVKVVAKATNQEFTAQTSEDGTFTVPTLTAGIYTATVTASGFKQSVVTDIKIDVGKPSSINVELEIGAANEIVTVVGGGELLQTQTATVGTTLTGRQITDLPTASRDALDLVLALPGTTTPGRPRTSSVNGLPKGALNITLDGINVQDNLLKSNDGFFTYVRPRTDAISEVTVSTSNPGSESSAEGAVQIKFVTQGGSNEYHGGLYWYHRNPALNANYWFSNRDLAPDFVTKKAPQQRILLNQPGGKFGGPITIPGLFNGKDRAFFFVNYEEYRLPEKSPGRVRTILSPEAQSGIHRFTTTLQNCAPLQTSGCFTPTLPTTCTAGSTRLCSVNVFTLAANAGLPSLLTTPDPTISALLGNIRSSLTGVNAVIQQTGNPNLQQATFFNTGGQVRKFPTVRFDFKLTNNHHIENIWNYQQFRSTVDFLNGVDPIFPGFPNFGSQDSNRFSNSTAWRWTITNNIVNEARFGLLGGTTLFFPQVNPGQFENQGGVALAISAAGVTNATATTGPQRRNTPVKQFTDTLSWVKGNHSLNMGASFTRINFWQQLITVVPTVNFGISSTLTADRPAWDAFGSLAGVNQQAGAAALYSTLAGRISSITRNARLSEDTNRYTLQGDLISRAQQSEYGLFIQDTWRVRPNVTLTAGLRWEVQGPFTPLNDTYARASSFAGLYGESGEGNIFQPGVFAGSPTTLVLFGKGSSAYETRYDSFAPSIGITYSPNFQEGWLKSLFGESGRTVLRGGFSRAYVREGVNTFQSLYAANAASGAQLAGGTINATQNITGSPFPLSFGNYFRSGLPGGPAFQQQPVYPNTGSITDSINEFLPDLKIGHVDSFTFGIQREIDSNNVIEVRYVGNRGNDLWRQYDLNEVNVIENGFLQEFALAQQNFINNVAAGRGANFRYFGPGTNTSPLPIFLAHISGVQRQNAGNCTATAGPNACTNANMYGNALFANATLLNFLNPLNPNVGGGGSAALGYFGMAGLFAGTANESLFAANKIAAGIPSNFWLVNSGKRGGAFLIDNSGKTTYDAITVEFRRRMTRGLLTQISYTFGKALVNSYASSSGVFDQPATLRDMDLRRNVAPFDITQALKANFIYELPVGRGKQFFSGANGWVNGLVGGWGFNGNIRIQSGTPFSFGNVQLVGMTQEELQDAIGIYRNVADADGVNRGNVFFLPEDIRINSFKANNIALTSAGNPVFTQGAPTGRFIAPAAFGNCRQAFLGSCGFQNLVLKGPAFFRSDLSIVKKVNFTETMNLELRGEFLNAFNNINFLVGAAANDVNAPGGLGTAQVGRYTAAYQDISTTNDPGGRLVQLVVRFNF